MSNAIVTCILTAHNHILPNMQDHVLQLMQSIQFRNVLLFSMAITYHYIGEDDTLTQNHLDGYEAMGFDIKLLTQDQKKRLFTIKTNMQIHMSVSGDSFTWAKYGQKILPGSLSLTSKNKVRLHGTFQGCLIEFICIDLDGNLSFTLNPFTSSKLDNYLSTLSQGLSETMEKGSIFDQHMMNAKSKDN
jgi:hypothetical protein